MEGRRNGRSSKWKVVVMEGRRNGRSSKWRVVMGSRRNGEILTVSLSGGDNRTTSIPCCYENNLVPKTISYQTTSFPKLSWLGLFSIDGKVFFIHPTP